MTNTVSVIVPTYNCKAFVSRAVDSALAQSMPPIEIIAVDDCSDDGTQALLQAISKREPSLRLLSLPQNGGPSAARNAGIAAARGDWIALLDADDAYTPNRLDSLISFAIRTGANLVADDLFYYDAGAGCATGNALDDRSRHAIAGRSIGLHDFLAHNLADGQGFDWGLLKPVFRRSALMQHAVRYDPALRHGEDFRFMVELLLSGADFRILPQPHYLYTQRQGARSGRTSTMSRTTIAYQTLAQDALTLSKVPGIAGDARLVALLQRRAAGLRRLDDAHFVSQALRSAAIGSIIARTVVRPSFLPFMLRQIGRAMHRRVLVR